MRCLQVLHIVLIWKLLQRPFVFVDVTTRATRQPAVLTLEHAPDGTPCNHLKIHRRFASAGCRLQRDKLLSVFPDRSPGGPPSHPSSGKRSAVRIPTFGIKPCVSRWLGKHCHEWTALSVHYCTVLIHISLLLLGPAHVPRYCYRAVIDCTSVHTNTHTSSPTTTLHSVHPSPHPFSSPSTRIWRHGSSRPDVAVRATSLSRDPGVLAPFLSCCCFCRSVALQGHRTACATTGSIICTQVLYVQEGLSGEGTPVIGQDRYIVLLMYTARAGCRFFHPGWLLI